MSVACAIAAGVLYLPITHSVHDPTTEIVKEEDHVPAGHADRLPVLQ